MIQDLTVQDFCKLFGVDKMPLQCVKIIQGKNFRYTNFSQVERDKILLDFLKRIEESTASLCGEGQTERWKKGWSEILDRFRANPDRTSLIPQYNRRGQPIRLFGDYVKSLDNNFENNFIELLRTFVFEEYLRDRDSVYEFGCGSAYNLVAFADMDSTKYYFGTDWVPQSKQIIDLAAKQFGYNIEGDEFDMFNPNFDLPIREGSALVTIGSLEQLGNRHGKFMEFLLQKPFSIYIHVNSILELYDIENNITDYLTYRFEKLRNYCDGFFTSISKLESQGAIRLLKMHRICCGGLLGDGYSLTVWEKC